MSQLSRSDERLVTGLARRKVREEAGLLVAEGVRVVEELLAAGIPIRLAALSPELGDTERGRALAAELGGRPEAREVSAAQLAALSDTRTSQGVLVVAEAPARRLEVLQVAAGGTVLVADGVQDPGNLGTLARSAAAFACDALVCLPGTVDPWNPKAVRASAGALFRVPVAMATLEEALAWLGAAGITLLGADAAGEPVEAAGRPERVALAVGNEGAGLTEAVRAACDGLVAVPMAGGTESLNVAVATGILLYELTRGRK